MKGFAVILHPAKAGGFGALLPPLRFSVQVKIFWV